jgi:hypothetical protein
MVSGAMLPLLHAALLPGFLPVHAYINGLETTYLIQLCV